MKRVILRWAVKEAAYKAFYPVVKPTWKEITFRGLQANGAKPVLEYHPLLICEVEKVGKAHVSISHDGDYVFASVLVENPALL